ncbi:MAG TPA: GIY-YIG nuclease family protein [Flavobacteriaceae bacterium]|nr:GIY-YIG nuclease family protein [Flavobacteriaceae bacterium]
MKHFVYIIHSSTLSIFYKGYSLFPFARLVAHNSNKSRYTRNKGPWELVFLQSFATKREALIRERSLKKYSHSQLEELIVSAKNEI